ncbi:MAG TPA: DNRLRE domain-containing protein [Thermomicrobiales bacterium]|nr:DNRLRE domain-containing protein [Thermomicrobiales bacterium]
MDNPQFSSILGQRLRTFLWVPALVFALLAHPLWPLVAQASPPQINIDPSSALAGNSVTLSGIGFPPASTGQVLWDDGSAVGTFIADEVGTYAVVFVVPPSIDGPHTITATTDDGMIIAQTTLTVEPVLEPTPIPSEAPLSTEPPAPTEAPVFEAPPTNAPNSTETVAGPTSYPIFSSSHSENGPDANVVYDGDPSSYWVTAPITPDEAWIILDLGAIVPVSTLRWQLATSATLPNLEILLSEDGVVWESLVTIDGTSVPSDTWIDQPVNVWLRYVQLRTENMTGLSQLGGIAEIELWPASDARPISVNVTPTSAPTAEEAVASEQTEPSTAIAQSDGIVGMGTITGSDGAGVNCRVAPDIGASIITVLPPESAVEISGTAVGDWIPVDCGGQPGFVHSQFVTLETGEPTVTTSGPATPATSAPIAVATPQHTHASSATPTDQHREAAATLPGPSLSLPLRGAFYYPWYPEAWTQSGVYPYTDYEPVRGYYDGSDGDVISGHIADMQYGNIDVGIASWWGPHTYSDQQLPLLLDAASGTGFTWIIYHEDEGFGNPNAEDLRGDLEYIRDRYASDPSYLRVDGRFVVFVYGASETCGVVDRWTEANETVGAFLVLKVFKGYQECANQPHSWHQYGPAQATDSQAPYSFSISPGFDKYGEEPRLSRDLTRWQQNVRDMVASNADWQLITTFNEWGEGTSIENAVEWESASGYGAYLDILHSDGSSPSPPPTEQSTPVATPTPAGPLVITPIADASVYANSPDTNFGSATRLEVDEEPRIESYLLFEVVGADLPIQQATLRLWVVDETSNAPPVRLVENPVWSEDSITWQNRPDTTQPTDDKESVPAGNWVEYDVTPLLTGNGLISFAFIPESRNGLDFNSREATGNHPQLVIIFEGSGPSPTVSPGPTTTPSPIPVPTQPPDGNSAILLAAGDIASCSSDGDEQTASILDKEPGTIATLGDNAYNDGTAQQFRDCYDPSWGRHKSRTYPSPGNHDYRTNNGGPYFDYFGPVAGIPGQGYYSYDLGSWHIISLNSNIDMSAGSPQEQWLRADLQSNPATCTLAYWHHPLYSSSSTHGSQSASRPLFQALYDYGAEVVLVGHDHTYERFAPQTPRAQADEAYGIRQFVVGTGGRNHYSLGSPEPNSEVRSSGTFGILKLTLGTDHYTWEFLPVDGKKFADSGSGPCHDAPGSLETSRDTAGHLPERLFSAATLVIPPYVRRSMGKWRR